MKSSTSLGRGTETPPAGIELSMGAISEVRPNEVERFIKLSPHVLIFGPSEISVF